MARTALKVVESPPFYSEEVNLSQPFGGAVSAEKSLSEREEIHSLHQACSLPYVTRHSVVSHCIERFSRPGDVIFDPFCGSGTVPLESNLRGRVSYASDANPLCVRITQAKLDPADLTEVTLALQQIDLRRPVNLRHFEDYFAPFYDVQTFCELLNLKRFFERNRDRAASFVEMLSLGLLHGPSAGYFSVSSPSQYSLSPLEQEEMNVRRRQIPDHRPIAPRVLKRSAASLRDGFVSATRNVALRNISGVADARRVNFVPGSSVDLVLTSPPVLGEEEAFSKQWLKLWMLGLSPKKISEEVRWGETPTGWCDFMNEFLVEMARVVRPSGRVVLNLCSVRWRNREYELDKLVLKLVEDHLYRFWDPECLLVDRCLVDQVAKRRAQTPAGAQSRILVLRRY